MAALAGDGVLAHGLGISFGLALLPGRRQDARGAHPPRRPGALRGQALRRRRALRAARRLSGHTLGGVADPGHVAVGTWSGGRFMRFGEAIDDERLAALLRPGDGIDTVLTADAYGAGEADELLGRALRGVARDAYCLVGAVGHDFYEGEREGSKGFPRFTDPRLRGADEYAVVPAHGHRALAASASASTASTCCCCTTPTASATRARRCGRGWRRCATPGLTRMLGVAPGPANGFTLDVIDCLERFGELIDWAMVILNPLEPWPGELVLPAARRYGVDVITRVVDYGGLFWDDVRPGHAFAAARPSRLPPRRLGARPGASAWSACARSPSATG